ncbi:MAG: hypothetical protein FJ222_09700 [Lentisphaerae bacterium]|nr:hypothetical protein [Lentisphaerota bacterium]
MELEPHIIARTRLSDTVRDAMFDLHARHFVNVSRPQFMADLDEKDWIILLLKRRGGIAGFSTQKLLQPVDASGAARFLFSGDTSVEREHWNTPFIAGCFGHLMLKLMDLYGENDLYWFLISKGFRTYRFLPVFFNRFWPASDRDTPPAMAALLSAVATSRFGNAFDPASGLIRIPGGDRLVPELAEVPGARRRDPHVAYFLARNPRYAQGDELACLAPIRRENLNTYARRVIRATTPVWQC